MSELQLVRQEISRLERELEHYRNRERSLLLREQIRSQHAQSQEYDDLKINDDESMPSMNYSQAALSQASGYNTPFGYMAPHERNVFPSKFNMKVSKSPRKNSKSPRKNSKSPRKNLRKSLRKRK